MGQPGAYRCAGVHQRSDGDRIDRVYNEPCEQRGTGKRAGSDSDRPALDRRRTIPAAARAPGHLRDADPPYAERTVVLWLHRFISGRRPWEPAHGSAAARGYSLSRIERYRARGTQGSYSAPEDDLA